MADTAARVAGPVRVVAAIAGVVAATKRRALGAVASNVANLAALKTKKDRISIKEG